MPVLIGPRVLRPASHVSAHGSRRLRLRTGYYWVNRRLDYFKLPLGGFQSGSGRLAADLGRIRSGEVDAATSTSSPLSPRLSGLCYRQKIYSAINYLTTYDFLRKATLDMSCFRLNEKVLRCWSPRSIYFNYLLAGELGQRSRTETRFPQGVP